MPGDEFDRLSLEELMAMCEWWDQREMMKDYRAGVIACTIVNSQIPKDSNVEPFEVWDFFPRLKKMKPPPPPPEEIFDLLRATLC